MMIKQFKFKLICLLLIVIFASNQTCFAGDTSNLEGAWLLDETSGTRFDQTANNNDLTDNNTVVSATGQFGNAADFTSANSEYLNITDGSQTGLDVTGAISVFAWVNLKSLGITQGIISKQGSATQRAYSFFIDNSTDKPKIILSDDGSVADVNVAANTALSSSTWTHIGFTFDTTNYIFYNTCSTDGSASAGISSLFNSTGDFQIGSVNNGTAGFADALIDEAFVFSRDISAAECADIKDNGLQAFIGAQRNRFIIVMFSMWGWAMFQPQYYSMINNHRKKFGIERPWWMRLFDIPSAYANPPVNPSAVHKAEAQAKFVTARQNGVQPDGKYRQVSPQVVNGITYETHVYDGPQGVGYILRAVKTDDNGDDYLLEEHHGPETDRDIPTDWRKIDEAE